jgi:DNA-binding beta-propeller fold protein YncE
VYVASNYGLAAFARRRTGRLTQLRGKAGCIVGEREGFSPGNPGCAVGRELFGGEGSEITVSPDGRSVYAASFRTVAVFRRDRSSGVLRQVPGEAGCIVATARPRGCRRGRGFRGYHSVAVSPDGRNVYVGSSGSDAVAVFARNRSTGALTQLRGKAGCVSRSRREGCARGRGLFAAAHVVVSPDGRSVYVAASSGVAAFARNRHTGRLAQLRGRAGCISQFERQCAQGRGLEAERAESLALSPNGRTLYVGTTTCFVRCRGSIAVFGRQPKRGALTQLPGKAGCVTERVRRHCARTRKLPLVESIAVSGDGRSLYVASRSGVAAFARNRSTGALAKLSGRAGCVTPFGRRPCSRGTGVSDSLTVAVSRDGRNVYVASRAPSAVAVFTRQRRTRRGSIRAAARPAAVAQELDLASAVRFAAQFGDCEFCPVVESCKRLDSRRVDCLLVTSNGCSRLVAVALGRSGFLFYDEYDCLPGQPVTADAQIQRQPPDLRFVPLTPAALRGRWPFTPGQRTRYGRTKLLGKRQFPVHYYVGRTSQRADKRVRELEEAGGADTAVQLWVTQRGNVLPNSHVPGTLFCNRARTSSAEALFHLGLVQVRRDGRFQMRATAAPTNIFTGVIRGRIHGRRVSGSFRAQATVDGRRCTLPRARATFRAQRTRAYPRQRSP